MTRLLLAAAFVAAPALRPAIAEEAASHPTLAIGSPAPDFDLPGIDGRQYSLKDFASARLLAFVFTANHCPTAQAYEERLQKLHDDYSPKGVAIVAVSPNDPLAVRLDELGYTDLSDTLPDIKLRAQERRFTFPYLYDGDTQAMSRKYGPVATPHVFIFDQERKLRFAGRVDDNENPAKVNRSDTRGALDALLAGKPAPAPTTKVFGCSVKWSEKKGWVADGFREWAGEPVSVEAVDQAGLKAVGANGSKKLRLVNAWATWCGPCVIEFPELVKMHRMYRGRDFEMVTVNADLPEKREAVLDFLKKQQASSRNLIFEKGDPYALIEGVDPSWAGALPHTVLIAPGGKVIYRSEGIIDPLAVRRAIVGYLGRYYHSVPGQ